MLILFPFLFKDLYGLSDVLVKLRALQEINMAAKAALRVAAAQVERKKNKILLTAQNYFKRGKDQSQSRIITLNEWCSIARISFNPRALDQFSATNIKIKLYP